MNLTLKEGSFLVRFAREEIKAHFEGKEPEIPEGMEELMSRKSGIFIKLNRYPSHSLRGCFGYTEGIMPLGSALRDISIYAAFRDHRFHPLRKSELNTTVIEVSILSEPELIHVENPEEYPGKIKIGRDGLIAEKDSLKGVLLPQMPIEFRWNPKEFLSHTCMMAGLEPGAWHCPDIKIYKFSAQIFAEEEPNGKIIRRKLRVR
ncbi:MAG: TIGR00296 family protein [Candidatus Altiarchaeales archaeon]|nr:MAG: TIGR00296 family protein [Candidatus Altiarchaeales archaeon]